MSGMTNRLESFSGRIEQIEDGISELEERNLKFPCLQEKKR